MVQSIEYRSRSFPANILDIILLLSRPSQFNMLKQNELADSRSDAIYRRFIVAVGFAMFAAPMYEHTSPYSSPCVVLFYGEKGCKNTLTPLFNVSY